MNRRKFLTCIPAIVVAPYLGSAALSLPPQTPARVKKLGPNEQEVKFVKLRMEDPHKPIQLRSKGNAIWINSVVWEGQDGARGSQAVQKNLPPGIAMEFLTIKNPIAISFAVTCLPLSSMNTWVELVG